MIVPLKLGKNVLGCIEVANKRGIQEFTDQDLESLRIISDNVSGGIISYEMRQQTLKREIDEDIKY
jgi:GAF domain-containing protein